MHTSPSSQIDFATFLGVDMRVGTVVSARMNEKAKKPALVLEIDFGELGVKKSSAQITQNYTPESLIGKQVIAVVNFPEKQVASVLSQVLVLGALDDEQGIVLLEPERDVKNGMRIA